MVEKLLNRTEVVRFKLYTVLAAAREQKWTENLRWYDVMLNYNKYLGTEGYELELKYALESKEKHVE